MTMRIHLFALSAACLLAQGALACTGNAPPPQPPATNAAQAAVDLRDTAWGGFNSRRFNLSIELPEGPSWRIDDHSSEWLTATHPSNSMLRARVWIEHDVVSKETCDKQARFWVPDLPAPTGQDVVDERDVQDFPAPGFSSHVVVGLASPPGAPASAVGGVALAVGASGRKCVVLVFTTMATGPTAAAALAGRLEVGTRIIESAALRADLMPQREPFQTPPR